MKNNFSLRQYYLFALLFPIIMSPLLFVWVPFPKCFLSLLYILIITGVAPYAMAAGWIWSKYKKVEFKAIELRNLSFMAPLLFVFFYDSVFLGRIYTSEGSIEFNLIGGTVLLSIVLLAVCYIYVILINIIGFMLLKTGTVRS